MVETGDEERKLLTSLPIRNNKMNNRNTAHSIIASLQKFLQSNCLKISANKSE
jgi:hypothetical protein